MTTCFSAIILHHVGSLFHGMRIKGAHLFRVTRNSNLYVDEEEAQNLLHAIETELRKVKGAAVRLEVEEDCPKHTVDSLLKFSIWRRRTSFASMDRSISFASCPWHCKLTDLICATSALRRTRWFRWKLNRTFSSTSGAGHPAAPSLR